MAAEMRRTADISACGSYRFTLTRGWGPSDGPRICFIMLNPSTADANEDDPTIRRCVDFAQRWGAAGLTVVNLFAWRATDPMHLLQHHSDRLVGEGNNDVIADAARAARLVVGGWGSPSNGHLRSTVCARARAVAGVLSHCEVWCLGTCKDGMPRHPLYLKAVTTPRIWKMPEVSRG